GDRDGPGDGGRERGRAGRQAAERGCRDRHRGPHSERGALVPGGSHRGGGRRVRLQAEAGSAPPGGDPPGDALATGFLARVAGGGAGDSGTAFVVALLSGGAGVRRGRGEDGGGGD